MSDQHDEAHQHAADGAFPPRLLTPAQNREREIRVKAIEALLVERELVSDELLDSVLDSYENDIGPLNGCRVVARAWVDPAYKERLLDNGTAAMAELGFGGLQGEHLVVVENTPETHNVIVCALCSCYPWPVLGLPPFWYKSRSYRSRVAGKPREVLHEFGLDLDEEVQIQVWNSNFQTRYMVLPERPLGSEQLTEEELAAIVTRDAMIG
ncbi:MAG: nitrile hydratase subunit alpha, partial [bacterium]|nr:nitrile hydratase subunit alpha [bacterium]